MAALLNQDDQDANTNTAGGASGAVAVAGSTSTPASGSVAAPTAPPSATNRTTSNQQDQNQIVGLNQGFNFSPLLDTVRTQGTSARNAVNAASANFTNSLGPTPTFGSSQQNTLSSVINGTDPTLADGSSILNYNPAVAPGINNSGYDPLVSNYQNSANGLSTQSGLSALLSSQRPDLTPGDVNFDTMTYWGNPNFQNQSQGIVNDANNLGNLATGTTTNAANALSKRATDVTAFDQAGKGFVNSQLQSINAAIAAQQGTANQYDQNVASAYQNLKTAGSLSSAPASIYNFDPSAYAPQVFAAQQAGNPFAEGVSPNAYLTYNQGQLPTTSNTATPQQVAQFNNIEQLLQNPSNQMIGSTRTAPSIGIDNAAWQAALAKALSDRDASDAAWLAAHQPPPPPPPPVIQPVQQQQRTIPGGSGPVGSVGIGSVGPGSGSGSGGGDGGSGSSGGGDGGGVGAGSGSGSGGGGGSGGGERKGGFVKVFPRPNVPVARRDYEAGGPVPLNAGPAGIDTVPTNVNNGEYVINQPSTNVIGGQNLSGLNNLNTVSPARQHAVNAALHAALAKAGSVGLKRIA